MEINKTIHLFWRDWAAVVYLFLCIVDFFIAPLIWNIKMESYCIELGLKGGHCDITRWAPLTLGAGGLFHLSFGAILGATSWNKHKEITNGNGDKPDSH